MQVRFSCANFCGIAVMFKLVELFLLSLVSKLNICNEQNRAALEETGLEVLESPAQP